MRGGGASAAAGWRRRPLTFLRLFLMASSALTAALGLIVLILRSATIDAQDHSTTTTLGLHLHHHHHQLVQVTENNSEKEDTKEEEEEVGPVGEPSMNDDSPKPRGCATVEEMGHMFGGGFAEESLRVRQIIGHHFSLYGASRVRDLPPEQFCKHGFVLAKASEAGFGNEMYKILTAAALSVMLNRSLIIGQTRHIGSLSSLAVPFFLSSANIHP